MCAAMIIISISNRLPLTARAPCAPGPGYPATGASAATRFEQCAWLSYFRRECSIGLNIVQDPAPYRNDALVLADRELTRARKAAELAALGEDIFQLRRQDRVDIGLGVVRSAIIGQALQIDWIQTAQGSNPSARARRKAPNRDLTPSFR